MTNRTDNAYMMTIADIANGADPNELQKECRAHAEKGDLEWAQGMEEAFAVVKRCGLEYSARKMEEWLVDLVAGPEEPKFTIKSPSLNGQRLIRFMLFVDAPWMHRSTLYQVDMGLPDALRAFTPLPPEHDADAVFDPRVHDEIRKQLNDREKYEEVIVNALRNALRAWAKNNEAVKGVFPENIVR